ncbi:MAG TPA: TIGR03084 family metal-binding protein [Trebonia sp.]|nr:TIGR03084 family metal-binding protein [Trebonia sp.]
MSDGKRELVLRLAEDLAAETAVLLPLLAGLGEADWDKPTPAEGWSIRDQVTHLAFFDDTSALSIRDPAAFIAGREELRSLGDRFPDLIAEQHRHLPGGYCLEWLASSRAALIRAYQEADPAVRLPWYGLDFSLAASITGRLMETWAHGQDIADCLGATRPPTGRLRHVADIGIRARAFCFSSRGLPVPPEPVYIELLPPDAPGDTWTWGPPDAPNRVTGDALDFCLVVTQRRNVADTGLTVAGDVAEAWIAIAQAFAGRPTEPRPPAQPRPPAESRPPTEPRPPDNARSAS